MGEELGGQKTGQQDAVAERRRSVGVVDASFAQAGLVSAEGAGRQVAAPLGGVRPHRPAACRQGTSQRFSGRHGRNEDKQR